MKHFAEKGGLVVGTRDYHPVGHCSFLNQGGPCLPHCIQGNGGSHFYKPIGDCLKELIEEKRNVEIVFKGFHEDVESFGCFTYPKVPPPDRDEEFRVVADPRLYGCSLISAWTGA